jgi:RimJ/RimL family protein N-acetyltransferase
MILNSAAEALRDADYDLRFRDYREDDFSVMAEIRRDRYMQAMLLAIPQRTDDEAVREWIGRRRDEPGGLFRVVADPVTDRALGYIQIAQVHNRNRIGYGGMAVLPGAHGRGIGRQAIAMIVRLGREELGLRKLMSEIRVDNFAAIKLNLAAGYRLVGTISKQFVDAQGNEHDVLLVEKHL